MTVAWIATHQPVWQAGSRRVLGTDEDLLTLAVAAADAGLRAAPDSPIDRIILVVSTPDVVNSAAQGVIRRALRLGGPVPVEMRVGGAVATLEALASAAPGTLVIGAEAGTSGAASGAAFVAATGGAELSGAALVDRSLPMRVRHLDETYTHVYDDARLEREVGWRPTIIQLANGSPSLYLAGVPAKEAGRFGAKPLADTEPVEAVAPLFLLAAMASAGSDGRLVAVDSALGYGVDVSEAASATVVRSVRTAVALKDGPRFDEEIRSDIPVVLPAYDRAFDARLGLIGAQCECGEMSFPARVVCLNCGEMNRTVPVELPRTGSVYSVVTVHVKVPGVAIPFARAVVQFDDVPLRFLAPVTDAKPTDCAIGDRGLLVLRRIATREGVPDYGFAFQMEQEEKVTA